jgi:excisionase family DNA binding protein
MTTGPLTLELQAKTRPDRLIASIREQRPDLLDEDPQAAKTRRPEPEPMMTPAEVAALFRVDPKTVTRWAKAGKLTSIRTLGNHRRYYESEVRALLAGLPAGAGCAE